MLFPTLLLYLIFVINQDGGHSKFDTIHAMSRGLSFLEVKLGDIMKCMELCIRYTLCGSISYLTQSRTCYLNVQIDWSELPSTFCGQLPGIVFREKKDFPKMVFECSRHSCDNKSVCISGGNCVPVFQGKRCSNPRNVHNASWSSEEINMSVGHLLKYTCKTGYYEIGVPFTTCGDNQLWSYDKDFKCEELHWPRGTYTLVKPVSGCPLGWKEGYRYQDNEDSNNHNNITVNHHFFGTFGRNSKFYYCTKDTDKQSKSTDWPNGNYCILQHGDSCPTGFAVGSITWEDEDSNNENSLGGELPNGHYDNNTIIYYCCRNDGSSDSSILLPTRDPFFLLRFTSKCQVVRGMRVTDEFVHTDNENDIGSLNAGSGSHPFKTGGTDTVLYYCYYDQL